MSMWRTNAAVGYLWSHQLNIFCKDWIDFHENRSTWTNLVNFMLHLHWMQSINDLHSSKRNTKKMNRLFNSITNSFADWNRNRNHGTRSFHSNTLNYSYLRSVSLTVSVLHSSIDAKGKTSHKSFIDENQTYARRARGILQLEFHLLLVGAIEHQRATNWGDERLVEKPCGN